MSESVSGSAVVVNKMGVHARPASAIVKSANQFKASIQVAKGELVVNCKSIMGVLMLAAAPGSSLAFSAEGADAKEAVDALVALVESGFPGLDGD